MKSLSSYQSLRQSVSFQPFIKPKFLMHSQDLASLHIVNCINPRHSLSLLFKLTSPSGVFPENITLPQVVKKLPNIYENRMLVTTLTRSAICPWHDPDHTVHVPQTDFFTFHFNIILPFTSESQMVSFPQFSPPKPCMHLSLPHTCYIHRPPCSPWIWSPE